MKIEQRLYDKVIKEIENEIFDLENKIKAESCSTTFKDRLEDQLRFYNEILDLLFSQHDQINLRNKQLKNLYEMLFEEGVE